MDPSQNQAHEAAEKYVDDALTGRLADGPVGQAVQSEAAKTTAEFEDLSAAKTTPQQPAATGQPLTQYHSMFYRLLSWKNPRATAVSFTTCLVLIFASRYLHILGWTLRALYTALGITAAAELAGKAAFGTGFATQMRPKKYWTISRESLERFLDDLEQLINFVVIEFQRILFAENIWVTSAAFLSALVCCWLIKWLPLWGLALLATCTAFLAPLVYVSNREFIDEQINQAGSVLNEQTNQIRDLAAQHTNRATETVRSYAGEYTQKAQDMINNARGKASTGSAGNTVRNSDFPSAPNFKTPEKVPQAEPAF